MTEVAAAVIHLDGKVLICQRKEPAQLAGLWEFPGGKCELGETPEACILRECREELGVTLRLDRRLTELTSPAHTHPGMLHFTFFLATLGEETPQCLEHTQIRWVETQALAEYAFCSADAAILDQIPTKL